MTEYSVLIPVAALAAVALFLLGFFAGRTQRKAPSSLKWEPPDSLSHSLPRVIEPPPDSRGASFCGAATRFRWEQKGVAWVLDSGQLRFRVNPILSRSSAWQASVHTGRATSS
jgi:hypothetical protein